MRQWRRGETREVIAALGTGAPSGRVRTSMNAPHEHGVDIDANPQCARVRLPAVLVSPPPSYHRHTRHLRLDRHSQQAKHEPHWLPSVGELSLPAWRNAESAERSATPARFRLPQGVHCWRAHERRSAASVLRGGSLRTTPRLGGSARRGRRWGRGRRSASSSLLTKT